MLQIANHRLVGAPFVATPNMGGRIEPTLIVLHDTAGRLDTGNSVAWFKNPAAKVSAHIVVERDGSMTQMVPFDRAAWHAGTSSWKGRSGCNSFSIGIEIVSPGKLTRRGYSAVAWFGQSWPLDQCVERKSDAHGSGWWLPYTDAQIAAVQRLIMALSRQYFTITDVAAHWEISPGRKVDCGPNFPLGACKDLLIGIEAPPVEMVKVAQARLNDLGYWAGTVDGAIGARTRAAIRTFQEQNGLTLYANAMQRGDGGLDAATYEALMSPHAKPMPTGTNAVAAIEATAATSKEAVVVQRSSEGTAVVTLIDTISQAGQAMQTAESAKGLGTRAGDIIGWLMTPAGFRNALVLLACLGVWVLARRMAKRGKPAPAMAA